MTIYIQGKKQKDFKTGLEDIPDGKNCFDLGRIKVKTFNVKSLDDLSKSEKNTLNARISYYKNSRKISREKALEIVLRCNKYSNIAYSNPQAANRAAQIRRGGVI